MSKQLHRVTKALRGHKNLKEVPSLRRFFKCEKGQYGEGDDFLGIKNPIVRAVHKEHRWQLNPDDVRQLMKSSYNEERFLGLLYVVDMAGCRPGSRKQQSAEPDAANPIKTAYDLYMELAEAGRINNWNLVDCSAPDVVGEFFLREVNRSALHNLVERPELWMRRIAVVGSLTLIRNKQFDDTLRMCETLLRNKEPEDLMHKASGWMLREVGKRDEGVLNSFLNSHAGEMPRVMLRYSIERLPEERREELMSVPSTHLKARGVKRTRDA